MPISVLDSRPVQMNVRMDRQLKEAGDAVLAHIGMTREQMIACGDGYNDLTMIQYAGLGVAMENAVLPVRKAADFYKVPPDHVLVVLDDTALAVGKLRVRRGGSAGGHNGLKSIIQHLGTDQFPRLRVGVGEKPHPDYDLADWVLGRFTGEDKKAIDAAVKRAADGVECILKDGLEQGMNRFNG